MPHGYGMHLVKREDAEAIWRAERDRYERDRSDAQLTAFLVVIGAIVVMAALAYFLEAR